MGLSLSSDSMTCVDNKGKAAVVDVGRMTTRDAGVVTCCRCRSPVQYCFAMINIDKDMSIMIVTCNCRVKGGKDNEDSYIRSLAVMRGLTMAGFIDRHVSVFKADRRSPQDCVWFDKNRLVFRESGTKILVEYKLADLRGEPNADKLFDKGQVCAVPGGMDGQPVSHAWLHQNSDKMAILWADGRFYLPTSGKIHDCLDGGAKWQMIRQIFPDRYLLCGTKDNQAVVEAVDGAGNRAMPTTRVPCDTKSDAHISMIIEARRCKDKVLLVAMDRYNHVTVMAASRQSITVVKAVGSHEYNYASVADCRLDGMAHVYVGDDGGALKRLTIKFNK